MQRKQYVLTAFVLIAILAVSNPIPVTASTTPKLVLQITVDQLRGDLPMRFKERLGKGGFRYLVDKGTYYANA
ncbi:MAG: alkaline phosphatase family protein, partial [Gammaproteobacteria bacterium]